MNKIGCPICKYYQFDGNCTAFPEGIPMMFLSGEKHHTERMKFQENDLVFGWISPEEQGKRRREAIAKRCLEQVERHKRVAV
jgi:hypothetical protein